MNKHDMLSTIGKVKTKLILIQKALEGFEFEKANSQIDRTICLLNQLKELKLPHEQ